MIRTAVLFVLLMLSSCTVSEQRSLRSLGLPRSTQQVLLCTTSEWRETRATLFLMERVGSDWRIASPAIPARIGRSGLGWGLGEHIAGDGPTKHEGDGRAPAGIFTLGTAFGYALQPPGGVLVPYRQATDRDYFVDAVDSPAYNQWCHIPLSSDNVPKIRWASYERMLRDDDLYELGMVVNHNVGPAVAGRGSAIFLHVWRGPKGTTSGCTSMSRDSLLRVLTWLRPEAKPLLIQVPASELEALRCRE